MKRNPCELADPMALDDDLAGPGDRAHQRIAVLHPAQQMGLAAVDEALGQDAVEGVGELVLDGAGRSCQWPGSASQPARWEI